mgnify:CR=1 FL=1
MTTADGRNDVDEQIQQLYRDEFFIDQLNIAEENIQEFISFAEDNGLTSQMLQPENEMLLIEFLISQSEAYRERKKSSVEDRE